MTESCETLEARLDDFDPAIRRAALDALLALAERGDVELPEQGHAFNMHCHSFFSYNGYGYSPTALAWKGRRAGLCAMGLVDFDVLDGAGEFLEACRAAGLRACAGMETRVFVPEFGDRVINSPGEPGVSYHMGAGFTGGEMVQTETLDRLKDIAQQRNRGMVDRINPHLAPVAVDYDADVVPLTPKGNPTERHVCIAYDRKSQALYPEAEERALFWSGKLGIAPGKVLEVLADAPVFQGLIRSKTMKAGGVGYVVPEGPDFPSVEDVNALAVANGGVPTFTFLDGTSEGEQAMDELLDTMMAAGAAAANIIPDRNWNIQDPETKKVKVAKLNAFAENARARGLPLLVGTEMNAYGQRFVDDFEAPELAPLHALFLEGAHIFHAHTMLQAGAGMGYLSGWSGRHFGTVKAKNAFFTSLGAAVLAPPPDVFETLAPDPAPDAVAAALGTRA